MSNRQTATKRLRELLDEHGVEWWRDSEEYADVTTCFTQGGKTYTVTDLSLDDEEEELSVLVTPAREEGTQDCYVTVEQAIAVTLGHGKCRVERRPNAWGGFTEHCGKCGADLGCDTRNTQNFCPNCGVEIEYGCN